MLNGNTVYIETTYIERTVVTAMNPIMPRFVYSLFRQEPVTSFLITIGATDAAIGGLNNRGGLMSLGLVLVGATVLLRFLQSQRQTPPPQVPIQPKAKPQLFLPDRVAPQPIHLEAKTDVRSQSRRRS